MSKQKSKRIEVFRPGSFVAMGGEHVTFSVDDLKAIAGAYDGAKAPAPAVIGHPDVDAPAYAWASAFTYDEASERLLADLDQIEPLFADAVAAGRYKKISLALFGPDHPANPKPGAFYPKHIGFLGGAAPAVSGLQPVSFQASEGALVFEFGEPALRDVASLFQLMREFLIEKFGSEQADKTMPNWTIRWIDEAAERPTEKAISSFSALKEPTMADGKPDNAPDPAEMQARLAEYERREAERMRTDNLAFAEGLIGDGKLLPVLKDKVVGLLDSLSGQGKAPLTVSFADGGEQKSGAAAELLRDILKAQPKVVSFGTTDLGEEPEEMSLASADAVARKAVAFQSEQAGKGIIVSTSEAVDHVTKGAGK